MRLSAALRRVCALSALAAVAVGFAATLAYAVAAIGRPLADAEGNLLFEAQRLRAGLALYTDPLVGAFDYGPVPSRFYVSYAPLLPWLVSRAGPLGARVPLRALALASWLGLLAGIALRARAGCRRAARVGAALAASVFAISSLAASARPDAFAVLLAGVALVRTTNRGRIDGVSALLFGLAPWIKPNVLGLALGAFAVDLASRRAKALPPLAVCATTSAALLVGFTAATHGAFLDHLSRSMGQPLSLVQWRAQIPGRLQFVGLPLAVAACAGYLSRRDAGARLALGALVSSFGWALLSLAKIGSSACYWMEACVAGVVLVSRCPLPAFAGVSGLAVAVVALVQALWIEVATVRSAREAMSRDVPDESGILASARATCRADAGDVLLADDVGVELELDARVVDEPFQMTHLVRAGTYPEALWLGDVERPQVVGVLVRNDLLERPASVESVEYDRLPPHVRAALRARFRLADRRGDWRLYCARTP